MCNPERQNQHRRISGGRTGTAPANLAARHDMRSPHRGKIRCGQKDKLSISGIMTEKTGQEPSKAAPDNADPHQSPRSCDSRAHQGLESNSDCCGHSWNLYSKQPKSTKYVCVRVAVPTRPDAISHSCSAPAQASTQSTGIVYGASIRRSSDLLRIAVDYSNGNICFSVETVVASRQ